MGLSPFSGPANAIVASRTTGPVLPGSNRVKLPMGPDSVETNISQKVDILGICSLFGHRTDRRVAQVHRRFADRGRTVPLGKGCCRVYLSGADAPGSLRSRSA